MFLKHPRFVQKRCNIVSFRQVFWRLIDSKFISGPKTLDVSKTLKPWMFPKHPRFVQKRCIKSWMFPKHPGFVLKRCKLLNTPSNPVINRIIP